jgi:type 1 glutamine amidotransferase
MTRELAASACLFAACNGSNGGGTNAGSGGGPQRMPSALVFSRTQGYRHESIGAGVRALTELGTERGWQVTATEDATKFSDEGLSAFNVVVFLSTTGDVLDGEQQASFERFIRAGNGYVGIHAASDTEYDWPWYGQLVGAYFKGHPQVQTASVVVEDATHPSTAHLSGNWTRRDEWYGFRSNPRDGVRVLLRLDESSYMAGEGSMGDDHPIAWCHDFEEGRAFYTGLGHTSESYGEAPFLEHIAGGIEWAARARDVRD